MQRFVRLAVVALAAAAFAHVSLAQQTAPRAPVREIIHVKGDLYRARNDNWYTAFLVTPAGIILGDPINTGFAEWLKPELDKRFPDKPVR